MLTGSFSTICLSQSDAAVFRTQKSLDEGVDKMADVYRSYDKVGIKGESQLYYSASPFPGSDWDSTSIC